MKNNYEYTEYNDEKNTIPWKRIIIILLMLIIVIVVALLTIRGCSKDKLKDQLLQAGKEYYQAHPTLLPEEAGQCFVATLNELIDASLIKDTKKYQTCDQNQTYVKVCYLESKTYHYVSVLSCETEKTLFGLWADGTENDLVADKTDVRFKFLGEKLEAGIKHYYPKNLTDINKVKEYYNASPAKDYTLKEGETTGYKWYTQSNVTSYWNNGEYSSTQPSGYPNKGDSTTKTVYTDKKPETASYRTITSDVQIYRSKKESTVYEYICHHPSNENVTIGRPKPCPYYPDTPVLSRIMYTCDGIESFKDKKDCTSFTDWTTTECTSSTLYGITCEGAKGYKYIDTMWKWSKNETVTKYYPSGSSTASGEKIYYPTAPVSGAIRDDATKATVYKYYKVVGGEQSNGNYEQWVEVTDGYVFEDELISAFQGLGFDVTNLSDIKKIETLRYKLQLQYRDLED